MSVLATRGLTRRFGELIAVDGLTISVEAGEVFALLGANGAGKTVTMKMLTTLLRPSAGNARVAGFDIVHHATRVRPVIGYVPQPVSADGALTWIGFLVCNLLPVTIGNLIGGVLLVGLVYWFVYLRPRGA